MGKRKTPEPPPMAATYLTTAEAAARVGLSHPRLKAICGQHNIGKMFSRVRALTEDDLERIKAVRRPRGRPVGSKTRKTETPATT